MKKSNALKAFIVLPGSRMVLVAVLVMALAGYGTVLRAASGDSTSAQKAMQANYMIARYVMASGGVIGARSQNNVHHGTAGQTVVGGAQSANHILASGFWRLPAGPTGVAPEEQPGLPTVFALHQNYPNPFNPETIIQYDLPTASLVTVEVFNTVGQRICLVSSQVQGPGQVTSVWNGRDDQGKIMGSGVYFYRVTASAPQSDRQIRFQETKKMVLVK